MRELKSQKAIAIILLLATLCPLTFQARAQTIVTFPPSTWKMEAYGTWLTFPENLNIEQWGYDQFPNVTKLYFFNPQMGGILYDGWWWITSPNGNVTVNRFFQDKKTQLQVQGSEGAQYTVDFPIGGMGKPPQVTKNGAVVDENKGWSIAGETVTLQGTFHSIDTWELSWTETNPGTNPDTNPYINPDVNIPDIDIPVITDENLQKLGIAFIIVAVVGATLYGQYQSRQKTWKRKEPKEVKWERKGKPLE